MRTDPTKGLRPGNKGINGGAVMKSDLIMVLANVILIVACVFAAKTKYRLIAIFTLYLSGLLLLFLLVTNVPIIFSPFTPKYHGKVIDAETKKPLSGINIKAGWYASSASVGGASGEYYKIYKTKTDSNGEYVIPAGIKSLTVFTPISKSSFDRVVVTIYPHDYAHKVVRIHYINERESTVALEKVKKDKEFLDNILNYYHGLFLMHKGSGDEISDPDEKKWLKNAYYQFEKIYPYSREDKKYLESIATILISIKEPDCVYILQKILAKYPDDATLAWFAKNNINDYIKIYNIK